MSAMVPAWPEALQLVPTTRVRILYADTDKMGVVYHGTYLRFLESGRVEFIRQSGYVYARMESLGFALPVIEQATRFLAPAVYDDEVEVRVGLVHLSPARVHFAYELVVPAAGREGLAAPLRVLIGETRHACMDLERRRAARLPREVFDALRTCYTLEQP